MTKPTPAARSLSPPWLRSYFLDVAVAHGGQLSSILPFRNNKKVQVIKFLTRQSTDGDGWVWGVISDLAYSVPVRFSKEAIKTYMQDPVFGTRPIHEYKTAFITMKNFRPMCSRVPLGFDKAGMSSNEHLTLAADSFEIVAALGQDVWGTPTDIELDVELRTWVEGLRQGGGAGNVLKLMAQEKQKAGEAEEAVEQTRRAAKQTSIRQSFSVVQPRLDIRQLQTQRHEDESQAAASKAQGSFKSGTLVRKRPRERRWPTPPCLTDEDLLTIMSINEFADPNQFTTPAPTSAPKPAVSQPSTPSGRNMKRVNALDMLLSPTKSAGHPTTPSVWTPSVKADRGSSPTSPDGSRASSVANEEVPLATQERMSSPVRASPMLVDELEVAAALHHESSQPEGTTEGRTQDTTGMSYVSAPTPAQRPKPFPSSSGPGATQSPAVQAAKSSQALLLDSSPLNPAKARLVDGSYANDSHDISGPGRILVPNSDTSGTVSQPSQSQSQTRRTAWVLRSQNQNQNQSQDKEGSSQEQPTAQSLSYTSASQSQSQGEKHPQTQIAAVEEEPVEPSQVEKDVVQADEGLLEGDVPEKGHTQAAKPAQEEAAVTAVSLPQAAEIDDAVKAQQGLREPTRATADDSNAEQDVPTIAFLAEETDAPLVESEIDELESDDARTQAMILSSSAAHADVDAPTSPTAVQEHQSERYIEDTIPASQKKAARKSRTRQSSSRDPAVPSSPDVFMSEASFSVHAKSSPRSASTRKSGKAILVHADAEAGPSIVPVKTPEPKKTAEPKPPTKKRKINPYHDAEAWAAPSYQRQRESKQTPQSSSAFSTEDVVAGQTLKRKRAEDKSPLVTPGSNQEHRPTKKTRRDASPLHERGKPPQPGPSSRLEKRAVSPASNKQRSEVPTATEMTRTDSFASTASQLRKMKLQKQSSGASSGLNNPQASGSTASTGGSESTRRDPIPQHSPTKKPRAPGEEPKEREPERAPRRKVKLGGFKLDLTMDRRSNPLFVSWRDIDNLLTSLREKDHASK